MLNRSGTLTIGAAACRSIVVATRPVYCVLTLPAPAPNLRHVAAIAADSLATLLPRLAGLRSGAVAPDDLLVYGARPFLEILRRRGLGLYLASGTDEVFVQQEVQLLNLARFFGAHIYGALDDYKQFSKQLVIERILCENRSEGEQLLSFGDGYVEIQNTKEAGGLAVAVASDEAHNGSGHFDEWKRRRLLEVGADIVIPDFRDTVALLNCILVTCLPSSRG